MNDKAESLDIQVGGDHYKKYPIQPVEFSTANGLNGLEFCIVKRIARWRDKGGYEDLRKIQHEAQLLIDLAKKWEDLTEDGKRKETKHD